MPIPQISTLSNQFGYEEPEPFEREPIHQMTPYFKKKQAPHNTACSPDIYVPIKPADPKQSEKSGSVIPSPNISVRGYNYKF